MLDKFYTDKNIAKNLIEKADKSIGGIGNFLIIEPSAGDGSFSDRLFEKYQNVIALDIEPDKEGIIKMDFFDFLPPEENKNKILTIGNPPFGRNSSLAYRFLDHAMSYSDYVAFLIPRTFKRVSFDKRINRDFHLIFQEDQPTGIFFPKTMLAKTVFQVWEKREYKREIPILKDKTDDFKILNITKREDPKIKECDFAVLAYGGRCGRISFDVDNLSPKSWHFIKCQNESLENIIETINKIDFSFSEDTVRQNSVGAFELIHHYNLVKT